MKKTVSGKITISSKKAEKVKQSEQSLQEFLQTLQEVTQIGKQAVNITKSFMDIKDMVEAEEIIDNAIVRKFGTGGAHIIMPSKHEGKKVKVIIKK